MDTQTLLNEIRLSTDPREFDEEFIVQALQGVYWAKNRPREAILKSLRHSLGLAAFRGGKQVGFLRAVTDYTTFAYLCDVVVDEKCRGLGIGTTMLTALFAREDLAKLRWILRTRDSHSLYKRFGFNTPTAPERVMDRNVVDF